MDNEFYVNGDSGYLALHCNDCDAFIRFIEAGDFLGAVNNDAELHKCKE